MGNCIIPSHEEEDEVSILSKFKTFHKKKFETIIEYEDNNKDLSII